MSRDGSEIVESVYETPCGGQVSNLEQHVRSWMEAYCEESQADGADHLAYCYRHRGQR